VARHSNSEIADEALAALRTHVLEPLVPRCIDREYGGFLVDFDERWRPAGPHDKTLEHASRTTIAFALLDQALPGEGYDRLVRHGCAFLQEAFWDAHHGGFFARVDRSGQPCWDGMKHPHAVTYAATAFLLAETHLAAGEGRLWAKRALAWLDDVAWDRQHAGYWGSFHRDNVRFPDGARLPTPDGRDVVGLRPGYKELNTLCDSIEMLTIFVAHGVGGSCADRLELLVSLVVDRLSDSRGVLPYLYGRDWRPVPDLLRIGQNFQMIHRLVAVSLMNDAMAPMASARSIADFCLASARHPSGGFCLAVTADGRTWPATGPTTDLRQWWVQLEAVHALHVLATHSTTDAEAAARYSRARDEQWGFLRDHFFDAQRGGIWELPAEPGRRRYVRLPRWLQAKPHEPRCKAHGWKDPLHEVRTFLALANSKTDVPLGIP
jgi:mannose/cellobiose epimerase-like protein (N-acyl-D-glucosamine 2-epimerase family)